MFEFQQSFFYYYNIFFEIPLIIKISRNENNSRLNTKSWRKSTPDLGLNIKDPKVSENNLHKETPKSYTPIVSIDNVSF